MKYVGALLSGFLFCGLVFSGNASAQGTNDMKTTKAFEALTEAALVASFFRLDACTNVTQAVSRFGTKDFVEKWRREVTPLISQKENIALLDFFVGSVVFIGGVSNEKGIAGLYSPWSDGILLISMRLKAGEKPCFDNFFFVSGESFRGENISKPQESLQLYQPQNPLVVEVAKLYGKSVAAFNRLYPTEETAPLIQMELSDKMMSQSAELGLIMVRQMYRMGMFASICEDENKVWRDELRTLFNLLEKEPEKLKDYASDKQRAVALDNVKMLPVALRANLTPFYFVPMQNGLLLALVNPLTPRWVVLVTYKGTKPLPKSGVIELLDLEQSEKIIELWRKEGK